MRETEIFVAVIAELRKAFDAASMQDVQIKQNYQPTTQGRAAAKPTLYLQKLGDVRHGSPRRADVFDPGGAGLVHTETQAYETMLQANGIKPQVPLEDWPTAADICNYAAAFLSSDTVLAGLKARGLGVLRIRDVRNPQFRNDQDQFEASPSFDFILTHEQIMVSGTPAAVIGELRVASV